MSSFSDLAESTAYLAGRDAARTLRVDGVEVTADDAETWCPRGMHPDDQAAWLRGWWSVWG